MASVWAQSLDQWEHCRLLFPCLWSTVANVITVQVFATQHKKQYWVAQICWSALPCYTSLNIRYDNGIWISLSQQKIHILLLPPGPILVERTKNNLSLSNEYSILLKSVTSMWKSSAGKANERNNWHKVVSNLHGKLSMQRCQRHLRHLLSWVKR